MISLQKMVKWIYLVTFLIPITNKNIKFSFWFGKGYFDYFPIINSNWPKPTTSFVEVDWGKIKEAPNSVLGLEHISPVLTGLDWAICARHSILPWVQSLLCAIPAPPLWYLSLSKFSLLISYFYMLWINII